MLENTRQQAEAPPATAAARRVPKAVGQALEELAGCKLGLRLRHGANGVAAGGVALRVSVREALGSGASSAVLRRVTALLHERMPLTLSLGELGSEDEATEALQEFCRLLRSAADREGLACDEIGLSLQSHLVPLRAYLLIAAAVLGRGPRYVLFDSLQMQHHDDERVRTEARANWSFLWQRRGALPALLPAYAASVTTHCPLLGDEAAMAILPDQGLQVPVESAWLPLALNLADFSDGQGRLQWPELERALETAVDAGDRLLEELYWPLPEQRSDAWQNRRLGVSVDGIGDLVLERGADPADLRCLQWIDSSIARIHAVLWNRSRQRARDLEPVPALLAACPPLSWDCDLKKSDWHLRWRRAVADSAVRHRNLLVMSPYSVLPARPAPSTAFVDLLPVLRHADAFRFSPPRAGGFRSSSEFANFHRRAWAVMQRRNAASLVATGV